MAAGSVDSWGLGAEVTLSLVCYLVAFWAVEQRRIFFPFLVCCFNLRVWIEVIEVARDRGICVFFSLFIMLVCESLEISSNISV